MYACFLGSSLGSEQHVCTCAMPAARFGLCQQMYALMELSCQFPGEQCMHSIRHMMQRAFPVCTVWMSVHQDACMLCVCAQCIACESHCSNWAKCGFPPGPEEVSSDSFMQTCQIIVPMVECWHHIVNVLRVGFPLIVHCIMHHGSKTGASRHCCSRWFVCWQEVVSPFLPFGIPIAYNSLDF